MNIILDISQIQIHNIFFLDSKKNIIMDGKFTKIIYSDDLLTTNGVFLSTSFNFPTVDKLMNKNILKFPIGDKSNVKILSGLSQIEQSIIEYYKHIFNSNKTAVLSLSDNMSNGCVKLYREYFNYSPFKNYIIKISGVWEDHSRIGITYKFLEALSINN